MRSSHRKQRPVSVLKQLSQRRLVLIRVPAPQQQGTPALRQMRIMCASSPALQVATQALRAVQLASLFATAAASLTSSRCTRAAGNGS